MVDVMKIFLLIMEAISFSKHLGVSCSRDRPLSMEPVSVKEEWPFSMLQYFRQISVFSKETLAREFSRVIWMQHFKIRDRILILKSRLLLTTRTTMEATEFGTMARLAVVNCVFEGKMANHGAAGAAIRDLNGGLLLRLTTLEMTMSQSLIIAPASHSDRGTEQPCSCLASCVLSFVTALKRGLYKTIMGQTCLLDLLVYLIYDYETGLFNFGHPDDVVHISEGLYYDSSNSFIRSIRLLATTTGPHPTGPIRSNKAPRRGCPREILIPGLVSLFCSTKSAIPHGRVCAGGCL
jgi:hypothetical protein